MEIISVDNLPAEEKKESVTNGVKLSGTAVFKKDKLVGYLNNIETRGLNWVTGKMEGGGINISLDNEENKLIPIRNIRAGSSIKPEINNGEISFNIDIKAEGDIQEQQGTADFSKPEVLEEIEKKEEEAIEKEIKLSIDKIKNELNSDILGFGEALSKKYPKEWKEIKDDWEDKFSEVSYKVSVEARVRKTGSLIKPILGSE